MKMVTATEASRNFASVLDSAERGETIVITRGGKRLAVLGPAPKATGRAMKDALLPYVGTLDDAFEGDVMGSRDLLTLDDPWND
ncbi:MULTISPECIES: type II toxin-antitoxin system Phd/YefM family antitoxin [unclassified Streptomyces]|uniref:Antitoxin n=1 Tax=Streptomyces sp. NBC_00180 TaxID=2903632 RepID=A0AAU1I937_9ACTN|nr:type II toxin-antitoxin system Phd/YefM family antitoxin [Streptomyces sp. NBC_01017]WSV34817.1 type II toxin-antitoxin system Phd/YefM family antitoxin [Streptomyces sp. NBC_01017]